MTLAARFRIDPTTPWTSCTRLRGGKTFVVWRYEFADGSHLDERVSTRAAA
jgi:hypothetical protein